MLITLEQAAAVTGGEVVGDPALAFDGAGIDSRTIEPGALFVAVRGERDGHDFVAAALAAGAGAALVAQAPEIDGFRGVVVPDTEAALLALAGLARRLLEPATVIAITGSAGKTSTKDLLAAALRTRLVVGSSPASFNNELGVPITLLGAPDGADAAVVEIGARGEGQIRSLAAAVRHRIGIVTNVGAAHTELFGSVDAVAEAKAELLETLPADGTAVVGADHDHVAVLCARASAPVVTVGQSPGADARVSRLEVDGELRPRFRLETPWGTADIHLRMRGAHQAVNAALAAVAAVAAGLSLDDAAAGLAGATGSPWRMEVERSPLGVMVINDAYNANPASTLAALRALADADVAGRRFAVLGEMAELGADSDAEHRRVGAAAATLGADRVVVVGRPAAPLAEGAREAGASVAEVADADEALAVVASEVAAGDAVLVKASRVAGLEQVAAALLEGTAS